MSFSCRRHVARIVLDWQPSTSESILSMYSVLSMTAATRPLSAGSITMSSSFCSRLSALCSSLVKLLSSFGVDCIVDSLVNDKRTYEELIVNPAPKLQKGLNAKLIELKKRDLLSYNLYHRLRCSAPQSLKLYGLPKLHKPQTPMRPIVSFCGSPTYQLSKHFNSQNFETTD